MDEFLNNLKKSLEDGVPDDNIINYHYEILHVADMEQKIRQNKAKDDLVYQDEIVQYVNGVDVPTEEMQLYNEEVKEFLGENIPKDVTEKLESQTKKMDEFEKKRIKRELIELNSAHILMIIDENKILQAKINKNNDLIHYLKEEMEKL